MNASLVILEGWFVPLKVAIDEFPDPDESLFIDERYIYTFRRKNLDELVLCRAIRKRTKFFGEWVVAIFDLEDERGIPFYIKEELANKLRSKLKRKVYMS